MEIAFLLRSRKTRALLVVVMAMQVVAFAIYLKAAAVEPVHAQTSQVKLWADPDRPLDVQTKLSPAPILLFVLLSALVVVLTEGRPFQVLANTTSRQETFSWSPNWLRPPPFRQ